MASVAKRKWTHKGATKESWVVRYKDRSGAHRSRQFALKKEADAYCRQVENELEAGTHVARSETKTVAQLMEEYGEKQERRHRDGTLSYSRVNVVRSAIRYINKNIGGISLLDLQWQHIEQLAEDLKKERAINHGRPLSRGFIATILKTLSQAIEGGQRRGYVSRNVVTTARPEIGPLKDEPITPFTLDEMQRILLAVEDRPKNKHARVTAFTRCAVYLGAFCGLRRGEILALTWGCLDLDRGLVRVRNSLDLQHDRVKSTKTAAGVRTVPVPPPVIAALQEWRRYAVVDERGLIFRSKEGRVLSHHVFYGAWYDLLDRAEIAEDAQGKRHFHALRHFAGSAWLDRGVPLPAVSKLLGHASPGITASIYAHVLTTDPMDRAADLAACAAGLIAQPLRIAA